MKNLLTGIVVLLWLTACSEGHESAAPVADAGAGKLIAAASCSGCHALDGAGKTAEIPNLAAQPAEYLADSMQAYREGRRHHAALQELIAGFSEVDIGNIAAYFSGLPPVPPAPAQGL